MIAKYLAEKIIDLYFNEEKFENWLESLKKGGMISYEKKTAFNTTSIA